MTIEVNNWKTWKKSINIDYQKGFYQKKTKEDFFKYDFFLNTYESNMKNQMKVYLSSFVWQYKWANKLLDKSEIKQPIVM